MRPIGKILALIIVVVLGLILITSRAARRRGSNLPARSRVPTTSVQPPATAVPATGSADESTNAIITAGASEEASLVEEESNAGLLNAENQEVSEFGQSYVENEF